jgi:hypothetical protein
MLVQCALVWNSWWSLPRAEFSLYLPTYLRYDVTARIKRARAARRLHTREDSARRQNDGALSKDKTTLGE